MTTGSLQWLPGVSCLCSSISPINGSGKGRGQMLPKFFKCFHGQDYSLGRSMTLASPIG